ncbi:hypothetical protein G7Z17_g10931 [Cylindrodendrum hubeiense]|uniref:Uncharacterized protein n=1 Tax=Cylindrodendrum hubeiense TaxID=595255 RepID=A0A9P5LC60_9HYPO|nr:hypothetical protein G7Z17_g10931 [Cylindrodendrum hubeiense]
MIPNPRCRFWLDGTVCIAASHRRTAPLCLATGCRLALCCIGVCCVLLLRLQSSASSSGVRRLSLNHWQRRGCRSGPVQTLPGPAGAAAGDRWLHASSTQELFLGGGESGRQPRPKGPDWDRRSGVPSRVPSLQRTRDSPGGGPVETVTTAAQKTPDARSDLVNHRDACTRLLIIHAVASRTALLPVAPHLDHHRKSSYGPRSRPPAQHLAEIQILPPSKRPGVPLPPLRACPPRVALNCVICQATMRGGAGGMHYLF